MKSILKILAFPFIIWHTAGMASRSDIDLDHKPSETLLQNRRKMGSAKSKMTGINERGNGRERPAPKDLPAKTDTRSAKQLSGRDADFELVTGRAPRAVTSKVREEDNVIRNKERKGKGRSDTLPSNLHVPIARAQRLATEDGRTSFHFSHDSIAKTRNAVVNDSGRVNRPGAAKAHNKYIERESAVAIDADGQEIVPANDTGIEGEATLDANAPINDNDVTNEASKEPYFDRPLSRSFLRSYRAALGTLLADIEPDPRGGPPDQVHGLRDLPGRGLVPDHRDAEMLLWSNEVHILGRDGEGHTGMRRPGDGDRQDRGGRSGRLAPVPSRLSRAPAPPVDKAIEVLGGRAPANDPKTPDGQGRYIERQEALAIQPDGTRVLFTNIDNDAEKRAEFWRLVEEHEREAGPDKMTFRMADNRSFWDAVVRHPECPDKLSAALLVADPTKNLTIETEDNVEMRRFLSKVDGWRDAGAKRPGENTDDYAARRREDVCKFQDGRGGRVQYRIIGELPHELSVQQRASILREFSQEFEKRKLPFVSVMHAPDHTNNDKNWHFHLVYYDRPCRRLTAEDVANVPADPNPKNATVNPVSKDAIGAWDFTVVERYKTSSREVRQRFPFAQEKVKEVGRQQDWVEKMRKRLADITNNHLQEAGVERRLDARRHSEMGIHSDPQEHLGTKLANLEAMGIATPRGVSNEERQWEAMQRKLDQDLDRRKSVVDQQARKWIQQAGRAGHLDDNAKARIRDNVTRWHQHRTEAEEHRAIAENVTQHIDRTLSRANKVRETCGKQLAAIDAGKVTKFQASRAENLQIKSAEAVEWLTITTELLKDEYKLAEDCRRTADRESLIADGIELVIERALVPSDLREVAAEQKRKDAERKAEEARQDVAAAAEREETEKRRRALVKEDMDKWLNEIFDAGRRLVRDGRRIVPRDMTDEDRSIVDAINFNSMQSRLVGMKRMQDERIAAVVRTIKEDPRNVVTQRTRNGETHVLVTSNNDHAKAFRQFSDDPEIAKARREAIERNAQDAARRAEERRVAAEIREEERQRNKRPDATQEPVRPRPVDVPLLDPDTQSPAPAKSDGQRPERNARERIQTPRDADSRPRSPSEEQSDLRRAQIAERQALNDRIARAAKDEGRRIIVTEGIATLPPRHLDALGVTPEDIADPALQKRLIPLAGVQDREIKRLTAYARKYPDRLVERDGIMGLSARAPREMVEIAGRWRGEQSVDLALRGIREDGRRVDAQPTLPVEPAVRPETPRPEAPAPARETTRTPEPSTPSREPARPRLTELEPDYDLREQARAYAEEQERRRQQTSQAAERARPTREQRTGEDDVSRAVRIASEKAATAGAHPLIDQWVQALRDGAPAEERRMIALRIENERAAREKLRDIDRQVARRIRDEAQRARDEQQPGLGLDIGQAPRR